MKPHNLISSVAPSPAPQPSTQSTPQAHSCVSVPDTTAAQPSSPPASLSRRRRPGKIARLPRQSRELLNTMLRDSIPYSEISSKMAGLGHQISPDNLSRWYASGHQDWLQHQDCLEEMRARLDFANDIVNEKNPELLDLASLRIAVTRKYSLLVNFDPAQLENHIANKPLAYVRILNVLCKLTETSLKCERQRNSSSGKIPKLL